MTIVTLTPNATVTNSGTVTGGGGVLHTVLSDSDDATYVTLDHDEAFSVSMTDLALPANAVILQTIPIYRTALSSDQAYGNPSIYMDTYLGTAHSARQTTTLTWPAITNHYGAIIQNSSILDANVDAAECFAACVGTGAWYASQNLRVYKVDLLVYYVALPVTNITAPTGTVTNDSTPLVTWSNTLDADGGPQTHFEVEILDTSTSTIVAESGEVASEATSWEIPTSLADDGYTTRVRVAQTVNGTYHWSAWDTQTWTLDVPNPAEPTMTLYPEGDQGRMRVEIDDPGGGSVATHFFHLEWSSDSWATANVVRSTLTGGFIANPGSPVTVYAYDPPNGVLCEYRCHASYWDTSSGVLTARNSSYAKDSDTWTSSEWWIKHPTRPSLNYYPIIKSAPSRTAEARQGVFNVLGRRSPVVVTDVLGSWTGQVAIRCDSDADRAALDDILADGQPLLIQAPPGVYYDDCWMAVSGIERTRAVDSGLFATTFDTLTWVEVDVPLAELEE